ncbi:MAG: hypothetical protein E7621_06435 [Ruminococcaceae bacterium]|nr:hypothetical protein [Oscillospiraceae bacterium]
MNIRSLTKRLSASALALCILVTMLDTGLISYAEDDIGVTVETGDGDNGVIPEEGWGDEDDPEEPVIIETIVSSAEELEAALKDDYNKIDILCDFVVDRTFYITKDTVIFSQEDITLTRHPDFGGDIFVFGPEDKPISQVYDPVNVTFGSEEAKITIDGNKSNVNVDVVGTVFLVRNLAEVQLFGVTVTNAKKVGNETILDEEKYDVTYKSQVGGAAIILDSGKLDIYDSEFINNEVNVFENDTADSLSGRGAAIYSFGELNIYNSKFAGNHATKGGAIYNYRETHLNDTDFEGNTSSTSGGAIYIPSSVSAYLFTDDVSFKGNTAATGGAIHSGGTTNFADTSFTGNEATNGNGGAIYTISKKTSEKSLKAENVSFTDNISSDNGGAVYITAASGKDADGNTIKIGSETLFNGVSFTGNKANGGHGGAIWTAGGDETDIKTIELYNAEFSENQAYYNGGAIYVSSNTSAYLENAKFNKNNALADNGTKYGGGAVYSTGSTIEINGAEFIENKSGYMGGAFEMHSSSVATLNNITATDNIAENSTGGAFEIQSSSSISINNVTASGNKSLNSRGGFMDVKNAEAKIWNSVIGESTATVGGAIAYQEGSKGGIYNTQFNNNETTSNGGAIYIYTNGEKVTLHTVSFNNNTSGAYGGAIYVSKASIADMYNISAKENSAVSGGFMYETTTGTVVNLNGFTVSGNTATNGSIIYGNSAGAKLNINKSNYFDENMTTELDEAYWETAIVNKLTVTNIISLIPGYKDFGEEDGDGEDTSTEIIVGVMNASEFEQAINQGYDNIQILKGFNVDRTFEISKNKKIFAKNDVILKRDPSFAGDMFILGPSEKTGETVVINFGSEEAKITIDGNKSNVNVDVVGTVFLVRNLAEVQLFGVTVTNAKKVGNETILDEEKYDVTYKSQVGGAAIILDSGKLDIYDSEFINNEVNVFENDTADSLSGRGAAIYSFGELNIYNSKFAGNHATKGGAIYNYRETHLNDTDFEGNTSSTSGGAIYIPSSVSAYLFTDDVSFKGNTAATGGAIHSGGTTNFADTSFTGNEATNGNGGAIYTISKKTSEKSLKAENVSFTDNISSDNGGAVYITAASGKDADGNTIKIGSETLFNGVSFTGNKANGGHGGAVWTAGGDETDIKTIELYNAEFSENQAYYNGGAIYMGSKTVSYMENVVFTKNKALASSETRYGGGALYGTGATIEINGAKFIENVSDYYGGAIEIHSSSVATLNDITAERNSAGYAGGFLYAKGSVFKVYNSYIKGNSAQESGGAMFIRESTEGEIHKTDFIENTAVTKNGGALYIYTNGGNVTLNKILLKGNTAPGNGGAIYASGKSIINMYNIEAVENNAASGGFMYETVSGSGTVVNLNGLTVEGNTASKGPIIFGATTGATLNINKSNYIDRDASGEYDDTYWESAIANKLTINDLSGEIPKPGDYGDEITDNMTEICDVRTVDELEEALAGNAENIRITSNIVVDRTLYVIGKKVLFTTTKKSVTRSPDFYGDMFVVGEDKDGSYPLIDGIETEFTLGNPQSVTENLLIINGNDENITGEITGSAMFVAGCAKVNIYDNTSIINNRKNGNSRIFDEKYGVNSAEKAGGSAIINIDGTITIYGGLFKDNISEPGKIIAEDGTESETVINGGAIHNRGTIAIYGGRFTGNEGTLGGVMYNLKRIDIFGGDFIENHAFRNGGAIYLASTQYAHLYIGKNEGAGVSDKVLFKNNISDSSGAALYNSVMGAIIINGDTTFEDNFANASGGAVATYGTTNIKNTVFTNNKAKTRGGAVYLSNSNEVYTTRIVNVENSSFIGNESTVGGAVAVYSSNADFKEGGIIEIDNCLFFGNKATNLSDKETTSVFGGAIYNSRKGSVKVTNSDFTGNTAEYEGGVIYAAGESNTIFTDSTFTNNSATNEKSRGGVLSVHSANVEFDGVTFDGNNAKTNGGALYISYTTASTVNSTVKVNNSVFKDNISGANGGAVYATEHIVEKDKLVLSIKDTEFNGNASAEYGGAVYLTAKVDSYMKNVDFIGNKAGSDEQKAYGGAVYMTSGSSLELDTAIFNENESSYCGGGIALHSASEIVMNNVTADGNKSIGSAGFLYGNNAKIVIFDSAIKNNITYANGGGVSLYNASTVAAYGVLFEGNKADGTGGAIADFSNLTEALLHSCIFNNNVAGTYGGAIYLSNEGIINLYNSEAVGNKADKGGFFYETTTGTEATIRNLVVENNSAVTDGDIIYGNSYGATLYIDKLNYEDRLSEYAGDDAYWDYAIKNMLTVIDISGTDEDIPERMEYITKEDDEKEDEDRILVPVQEVLSLGISSSDEEINSTYGSLPKLDNSSNFMSNHTTAFEDINGETVTVDTFVYHPKDKDSNVNFGMGMLIYQAILYKDAHPEEDVKVSIAEFRFEMETAICINRNSRYFGYMRNLVGTDYDKYGFVRISYLLVTAAKMGIDVTVMGQIPGYPHSSRDPDFIKYFEDRLKDPCDPVYVEEGKVVGDYMNFVPCEWTSYGDKGGSDMMHLKMATASHYLDMNGVAHKNALFTSTSNLDGINSNGTNGNDKMQVGALVSDHEALYRTASNYINLLAEYRGQEEVYTFRSVLADRTAEQFELILSGRQDEIPADKQIVYLGTDKDDVFELYFTPFGGNPNDWTEIYNPYCKFIKKLANSEDYIILIWNNANYLRAGLVAQIEDMIISAFHNNKNPNNKIYINLAEFNKSAFDDLKVGTDIGLKNFNKKEFGALHSKDLQISYVENGQRKYVTLFNTLNFHTGAISYQSNSVLVVKENSGAEGSVFFALADDTSNGIVEHTYINEKVHIPESGEDGYIYKQCEYCDKTIVIETVHRQSEWIVANEATESEHGIAYKECINCGKLLSSKEIAGKNFEVVIDYTESDAGLKLSSAEDAYVVDEILSSKPKTFEASFFLPKSVKDRAGVLIGNYNNTSAEQINVEIYSNGLPRLYYKTNKKAYTYVFTTDVRSDSNTHLAITIDGLTATLYLNGVAKETIALEADIADALSNYKIGADSRASGTPYFKGTIYSVSIFDDVRTNEEIELDMIAVPSDSEGLLFSKYFADSYEGVDNIFANNIYYDNEVWSCDLTLYSEDTVSGQVYVAVYEDKVLKNIVSYTAKSKLPVSVECDDGQTVKIFWWDSNLQPFSRMFEIEVK